MHECPQCYMVCDCDGEDTWNDAAARECLCTCAVDEDEEDLGCESDCDCGFCE